MGLMKYMPHRVMIYREIERLLLTIYMLFRRNSVRYKRTHLYKCNIYFSARGRTAMQATV